jgi:outer membrane protein OmpA-like peptidoglycan-associated protein
LVYFFVLFQNYEVMTNRFIFILLLSAQISFSQNMLVNGSFEQHIPLANKGELYFFHFSEFNKAIKGWQCNNEFFGYLTDTEDRYVNQADMISRCYTNISAASKGTSYVSLGFRGKKTKSQLSFCGTTTSAINLYGTISSRLKESLHVGKKYTLSFDIREYRLRKDIPKAFGVLLSTSKIPFSFSFDGIKKKPTFSFYKDEFVENKWKNLSVSFVADSTYKYFTIGFFDRPDIATNEDASMIYLDNICLREENSPSCDETTMPKLEDEFTEFNVYFKTAQSEIQPKYNKDLEYIAKIWKKYPTSTIYISGHTDNTGKNNEELSQKRAIETANHLKKLGVLEENIKISWFADAINASNNNSEDGKEQNRRVEIKIKNDDNKEDFVKSDFEKNIFKYYMFSEKAKSSNNVPFNLSAIGKHKESLIAKNDESEPVLKKDLAYFSTLKPVSAISYILQKAKNEQVIMLNEAHYNAQSRVFTFSLLDSLKKQGFEHVGFEALVSGFSFGSKKYLSLKDGYFTNEPTFHNLIDYAHKTGWKVFGYESDDTNFSNMNRRDSVQAYNISLVLKGNPKAKILIHAGYQHICETYLPEWRTMAYQFQKMTGINPLTISQVETLELLPEKFSSNFWKIANTKIKEPSIFLDKNKNPYSIPTYRFLENDQMDTSSLKKYYDISLFHPKTTYENNRPTWAKLGNYRKPFFPEIENIEFPCLLLAYKIDQDFSTDVPIDVIEWKQDKESPLLLPKGNYKIMYLSNNQNKILNNIEIK